MKKTLILISQSYLHWASTEILEYLSKSVRLILVLHKFEQLHPVLENKITRVFYVDGTITESLRPKFDIPQVSEIVKEEITLAGSVQDVTIFCQQEDNVITAAKIREQFGIYGDKPETVMKFRDKLRMKECVRSLDSELVPKYEKLDLLKISTDLERYYNELTSRLGNKMLVKPTSALGSINVIIINSLDDLRAVKSMVESDNHSFEYEIDEYISGKMYQCDSFVRNGEVVFSGILELGCSNFDFVLGKPLSVYPVTDPVLYQKLFDYNQAVITELGFQDGSTHHELFIKEDTQQIIFLEIAARVPGGIGVPFHTRNSRINLIDANLLLSVQSPLLDTIQPDTQNNLVSALLPVGHGTVLSLNEPDIASQYHIDWHVNVGEKVNATSLIDSAGILMFTNENRQILRSDFEKLQSWVPVTCV